MTKPNDSQARYWNEQAGQSWVAMQRDLDAELEPFGVALSSKLGLGAGERVLDVGCGAGATSLMLAERASGASRGYRHLGTPSGESP